MTGSEGTERTLVVIFIRLVVRAVTVTVIACSFTFVIRVVPLVTHIAPSIAAGGSRYPG